MKKETFCIIASALLIVSGIAFGVAGFTVTPIGEISESVLILIAQCFIMAGSFVGIDAMIMKALRNRNINKKSI